jgi:hypothetical protein
MNASYYFATQLIVLFLVLGLLAALLYGLKFAFKKIRIKANKRKKLLTFIGLGFFFWLAVLAILSFLDFFQHFKSFPPRLFIAFLPPLAILILLLFSRLFTLILKIIPKSWLIYIQSFRIVMELMLWLGFLGGFVPLQMTFHWLNQDIIVGLTALLAGHLFFREGWYLRFEAVIWNIFGMLLLFNIFAIALLSTPSPFRVFMDEPASTFVANFPFIWIPGFIVPFAFAMHLFSLKQLLLDKSSRRSLRRGRRRN